MNLLKIKLILLISLPLFSIVSSSKEKSMVIDAKANETQRISIVVGKAGSGGDAKSGIGTLAEGDEGEEGGGDGPSMTDVESTAFDWCRNNTCCYQFTWQGYVQDIPDAVENATCEALWKEKKDDTFACFNPLVYTTGSVGNGPDLTQLQKEAELNNWNIFCPLTNDKSCITLKYFSRSGGKKVMNETRWCGTVSETTSGARLTKGCYKQNVQGSIREACVCETSFCNTGSGVFPIFPMLFVILIINLFKSFTT